MSAALPVHGLLGAAGTRGLLLSASRDPDAKVTFLVTASPRGAGQALVCKIPTTEAALAAVRREARILVDLRRMSLRGEVAATIPRYVSSSLPSALASGTEVLVSTQLPGTPMSRGYHQWRHTARPGPVVRDLDLALGWLGSLWTETADGSRPCVWGGQVAEDLAHRWDGSDLLDPALERLHAAHQQLAAHQSPRTTVHGDFWVGNVLVRDGVVSGVVDWEAGSVRGWPLRDAARLLLSYSLYLDRHTRPGRPVPGHRGLRRETDGSLGGITHALLGHGWYPDLVRNRLADCLRRLGMPAHLWYSVALVGLGEVAVGANHEDFGEAHLRHLAQMPHRPDRPTRGGR